MNINPYMKKLQDEMGLNVYENIMEQDDKTYLVFNIINESKTDFADNVALKEECLFYLHLFIPINKPYRTYKGKIKRFLDKNGIDFEISATLYEEDTKLRHIVFECTKKGDYSYE